jgi:hypothetical protein
MTSIELFPKKNSPSLADQSVVRFDDEGNPLKMQFREAPTEEVSPLSIVPRTEEVSDETRTKVRELLPVSQASDTEKRESVSRESGKIVHLPQAQISVGGISQRAYEKKYGSRESGIHRFIRRNVREPIGKGFMRAGDFLVRAYGQSYLDRFDMLRLKFSDKNNNYSRGMIPKPIRTPLSLFGTPAMGNIPSLLLNKTPIGRGITAYREGRRERVDGTKRWLAKPFRRFTTNVSPQLPFHEYRYKIMQKVGGIKERISKGERWAESLIAGGMSGVLVRRKQKRAFRARQERLKMAAEKGERRRY